MIRHDAKWLLGGLFWLLLLSACATKEATRATRATPAKDVQAVAGTALLPRGVLDADPSLDVLVRRWYAKHLTAMKEPALFRVRDRKAEIYRFLWLRTFHAPIMVRVEKGPDTAVMVVKQLSGRGGFEPGTLVVAKESPLDRSKWNEFVERLDNAGYWDLSTRKEGVMGADGAQWVLEGVRDGRYHIVDRWSGAADRSFQGACKFLLSLSGLSIKRIY